MELCTGHSLHHRCPTAFNLRPVTLRRSLSPTLIQTAPCLVKSELRLRKFSLRATSEEKSYGNTEYAQETQDVGISFKDASAVEMITQVDVEKPEMVTEEYAPEEQSATFELLDKLEEKIDTDSTIPILLYSGGAIVSIWLASAVVGAIDGIPVFPKLMQVVGISYTVWFTSRYLIFKESRDELSTKIAELKLKILGSERN